LKLDKKGNIMSSTLTASSVKPGVRRSKSYTSGRVCDFSGCETV